MKLKRIIELERDRSPEGKKIKNLTGVKKMKKDIGEDLTHMKIRKRKMYNSVGKKEMGFRLLLNKPKI